MSCCISRIYPGNEVSSGWKSEGRRSVLVMVGGGLGVGSEETINRFSADPFLAVVRGFQWDAMLDTKQDEAAVIQPLLPEQDLNVGVVGDGCGCGHGINP